MPDLKNYMKIAGNSKILAKDLKALKHKSVYVGWD
jgi:hypothetical protein